MRSATYLLAAVLPFSVCAQGAGNELFDTDQVIDIQLTFNEPSYWDSLLAYYNEGLERQLLASVVITDLTGTYSYDSVGVRFKGNSSYGLPNKKSMKIDFNEYVSGQKYHGLKKINLNNGFNDPTMLREKVFFDFSRDQNVLTPRAVFGNLSINGSLLGFYGVVEQVDKEFLDRWVDNTTGNMFKAGDNFGTGGTTAADLAWYGSSQATYSARYELKTNTTLNDWSDLLDLIDVINNSSDADLEATLPTIMDWHPLLRSFAIDNLFANLDSYINSARNYYLYHNDSLSYWQWIKWDANEAFGRYSGGQQNLVNLSPDYYANTRPLMTKIIGIPSFRAAYHVEYCNVLESFTNALMDPHIDSLAALIQPSVFAAPNQQYTNAQFTTNLASNITGGGGGGGQTIYGLKSFITARRSYLSGALDCTTIGVAEVGADVIGLWPNPTTGDVQVRLPSGSALATLRVLDIAGRVVPAPRAGSVLSLGALPAGMYTVVAESYGALIRQRLIKE